MGKDFFVVMTLQVFFKDGNVVRVTHDTVDCALPGTTSQAIFRDMMNRTLESAEIKLDDIETFTVLFYHCAPNKILEDDPGGEIN